MSYVHFVSYLNCITFNLLFQGWPKNIQKKKQKNKLS